MKKGEIAGISKQWRMNWRLIDSWFSFSMPDSEEQHQLLQRTEKILKDGALEGGVRRQTGISSFTKNHFTDHVLSAVLSESHGHLQYSSPCFLLEWRGVSHSERCFSLGSEDGTLIKITN